MNIKNIGKTLIIMSAAFYINTGISRAESENNKPELRIMSYNIRHGAGMDLKVDLERIAEVIKKQNPDLIALQEVDNKCSRSGSKDIAAELGKMVGMQHRFGKFMDFGGGEYGMAVLSKLPIKETIRHQLPKGSEPRCALELKVEVPGMSQPLSFVCIHNDWITEEVRIKQIQTLLDNLKEYSNPIILAGDFNGKSSDKSIELLKKDGWEIFNKDGMKTWPADKPTIEIDFFVTRNFLHKSVIAHEVIDEREASDHRPIYAVIAIGDSNLETEK